MFGFIPLFMLFAFAQGYHNPYPPHSSMKTRGPMSAQPAILTGMSMSPSDRMMFNYFNRMISDLLALEKASKSRQGPFAVRPDQGSANERVVSDFNNPPRDYHFLIKLCGVIFFKH